jgi:predicted dehydrogenase
VSDGARRAARPRRRRHAPARARASASSAPGWIGRHRLEAIHRAGGAEVAAVADASPEAADAARAIAPDAEVGDGLDALLDLDLDGW